MEEKKETLLNSWLKLKKFIYNYPVAWFMIGFFLALTTFPLQLSYFVLNNHRNPFRSLLTFAIIFSFSIINVVANYDKNRSKFKWLFWDCLASIYLFCCSFVYIFYFFDHKNNAWIFFAFSFLDGVVQYILFIFESFLKDYFAYIPFLEKGFDFIIYDVFVIGYERSIVRLIFFFIVFIGYDIYKKKTIKEILRTRCFLMIVMLSLSRILFVMAVLLQ